MEITEEIVRQAAKNVYEKNGNRTSFHFKSFVIGLAVGLTICAILLIVTI